MTLRHNVKTTTGDSWASPTWAVVLPGGVGVDLEDGWETVATVKLRDGNLIFQYLRPDNIDLGRAIVTLSDGRQVTTSTVQLHHSGQESRPLPVAVALWDCRISKGQQAYTIASGSYRTVRAVTT